MFNQSQIEEDIWLSKALEIAQLTPYPDVSLKKIWKQLEKEYPSLNPPKRDRKVWDDIRHKQANLRRHLNANGIKFTCDLTSKRSKKKNLEELTASISQAITIGFANLSQMTHSN